MKSDYPTDNPDHKARQQRKKNEIGLILPILGIIMLLTPILKLFSATDEQISFADAILYFFGIWAFLIVMAFFLARALISEIQD